MSSGPVCVYDFTLANEDCKLEELINWLKKEAKMWVFQLEQGASGYVHYQGRLSLKVKARMSSLINKCPYKRIHFSPTSTQNSGNTFYVTKEETRVDGPWSSEDEEQGPIPWDVAEITELRPWQSVVWESAKTRVRRTVNVVIDKKGNNGKTTLIRCMCVHKLAHSPPFCNDFKDLMRMTMNMGVRNTNCYLIDMPRAIGKDRLNQLYSAVEKIKDGYAYDDRYKFQHEFFDPPVVWIFSNQCPDLQYLSLDRWKLWTIEKDELVQYHPTEEELNKKDEPGF